MLFTLMLKAVWSRLTLKVGSGQWCAVEKNYIHVRRYHLYRGIVDKSMIFLRECLVSEERKKCYR